MEKLTINGPFSIAMLNYQRVYPLKLTSLGHWRPLQCLRPTAAKRRLSSKFTISTGALPEHCWHPNWHPSIHRTDMNWSIFALLNLTSDDSMRRNISLILHIGSWVSKKSPLCRCQIYGWTPKQDVSIKRAALIMTRTHLKSRLLNFKETLKRGTRRITSIEIWSSDLELRYPLNLLNLTE